MTEVKPNSLKAWILAARPKTLTGAMAPVLLGGALAVKHLRASGADLRGSDVWLPFCLALAFAIIMQITANMVNDYFDFKKGTDREDRLGPERACAQGWIAPEKMKRAVLILSIVALVVGLPLAFYGGWEMVIVGIACVVFCWLYTTHLSYIGLGDLLVVVFFGLVPVIFTFYVMTSHVSSSVWLSGLAMGLCTDCLLLVNNYRDIEQDRLSGKRTLVVLVGRRAAGWLYLLCGVGAVVLMIPVLKIWTLGMMVYLLLHLFTFRSMLTKTGRELNIVLGATARNIFIFGLLSSAFILLS